MINVYVLFTKNIYIYDTNFDILKYPTNFKMLLDQYPRLDNITSELKNKYKYIYIGYSKADSTFISIKDGKKNIYNKWLKKERKWIPWMKMYCEIDNNKPSKSIKIGIHTLEVVDETLVEKTVSKWVGAYTKVYGNNVINNIDYPEPCNSESNIPESSIPGMKTYKDIGIQCDLIKIPKSEMQYKIGQEESQRRWREKNKLKLREYAKNYYIKKKKNENPE